MKTQTVKNALIVPTGAKGGFVVKGTTPVVEAYQTLVRGLLDLTDNLVAGRVVHPRGLVIHDEEDAYLVVAADKGTATFSDVANLLAAEYGFWLGDAVLARAAKRVTLSPEARAMLGLGDATVSGERLVQAVLTLDVDLLWNGGVGTYVAATDESNARVHDAVNDPVRVKASALRTRAVAEGGNLGFTQRARIEYALAGGRIDTDAVHNSAGVDMSDHEVNLKICLRAAVEDGRLSPEARNALLASVTDEVAARVLAHNRVQSRLLSLDQVRSRRRLAD